MKKILFIASLMILALTSCSDNDSKTLSGLDPQKFVDVIDSDTTALYVLHNEAGMEVCITNFGARIVSIMVPDADGVMRDVVLGFDNIKDYENVPSDFGATIGRYANRIAGGQFMLQGELIQLPQNNGEHCLHGGPQGWQYKVFKASNVSDNAITLSLVSPDGEMNFPGTVETSVTYTLTDDNNIKIDYTASTDKPTVINLTNHSYFNLSGDPATTATDHVLTINADYFTPADSTLIPTGDIVDVEGTPFDFRNGRVIEMAINDDDFESQIAWGYGIDHNFVLNNQGDLSQPAARLLCPRTGIELTVYTDQPGIQIYTGNMLGGKVTGKNGITYQNRTAVCLESQHYPDSPNKPFWPSVILLPGDTLKTTTVFAFGVNNEQ